MPKRIHVLISGRVQGVCFRGETKRMADSLGITGWVKNTRDGRVEAVFEGEESAITSILEWCRKGPPLARVTHLDVIEEPATGSCTGFRITY